jgi:magnesium chelatase family protein
MLTTLFTIARDNAAMSKRIQSSTMAIANTFAFNGIEAVPVEVQVQIAPGAPGLVLVGLPDKAVGEARERVRAAFSSMGLSLPLKRVLINLKPADLLKEGSHFDLPLALGLLAAMDVLPRDEIAGYAALGELSLDGSLNPVAGILPAAIAASARDLGLICPASQGGEAAWAGRIEVLAPPDLLSLINHFRGTQVLAPPNTAGVAEVSASLDMNDVKGMETAKRAVEIAAAGGHNLLLVGPPGAGKSMLAARLTGLLPNLDPRSALEVSMIHSIAGLLDGGRLVMRRITPPRRLPLPAADIVRVRARSVWRTAVCCSWTSFRSFPAKPWSRCGSRWNPGGPRCRVPPPTSPIRRASSLWRR